MGILMKKPSDTRFRQQQLKAWQPVLTPRWVIGSFGITGFVFVIIGIVLLSVAASTLEYETRYDDKCDLGQVNCTVTIDVKEKMSKPVYFYYKLTNFYQNHRRYVRSRSDDQLRGSTDISFKDLENCVPLRALNGDDSENKKDEWYYPCGLIAYSFFNDTLSLSDSSSSTIKLDKDNIAWESDVRDKFKNPPDFQDANFEFYRMPGVDSIENQDFIVWMRTAALPTFKKLYGVIDQDLDKGEYTVTIDNLFQPAYQGQKLVVLATVSWMGGKNSLLGEAYLAVGLICIALSGIFLVKHKTSPRDLADPSLLDYNN